eukprot:2812950-Amphidinium_carterae.2
MAYPFWPSNLASPYEWAREASLCPGIESPFAAVPNTADGSAVEKPRVIAEADIKRESLIEELRTSGMLVDQDL